MRRRTNARALKLTVEKYEILHVGQSEQQPRPAPPHPTPTTPTPLTPPEGHAEARQEARRRTTQKTRIFRDFACRKRSRKRTPRSAKNAGRIRPEGHPRSGGTGRRSLEAQARRFAQEARTEGRRTVQRPVRFSPEPRARGSQEGRPCPLEGQRQSGN